MEWRRKNRERQKTARGDGALEESENACVPRREKSNRSPDLRTGSAPWPSLLQEEDACMRV